MRGTIFTNPNKTPKFVTVSQQLSDMDILEIERKLIADGYTPIPNIIEYIKEALN